MTGDGQLLRLASSATITLERTTAMRPNQVPLTKRLGFFLSAWLVFLVIAYMVFANAGLFDAGLSDELGPYAGFAIVAAVVGALLWRVAGQYARDGEIGLF